MAPVLSVMEPIVIARNPNVTLPELMATIGHSSQVVALRSQDATAERSKTIADYLDDAVSIARSERESSSIRPRP